MSAGSGSCYLVYNAMTCCYNMGFLIYNHTFRKCRVSSFNISDRYFYKVSTKRHSFCTRSYTKHFLQPDQEPRLNIFREMYKLLFFFLYPLV